MSIIFVPNLNVQRWFLAGGEGGEPLGGAGGRLSAGPGPFTVTPPTHRVVVGHARSGERGGEGVTHNVI